MVYTKKYSICNVRRKSWKTDKKKLDNISRSNKRRVPIKRRVPDKRRGSRSFVLINAGGAYSRIYGKSWRSQMFALSDSEEIMSLSIAVWPQYTNVTDDRQTGLWQYRLIGLQP